jgi:hypothetical protein
MPESQVQTRNCRNCGNDECAVTFRCRACAETRCDTGLAIDATGKLFSEHPKDCFNPGVEEPCRCGANNWVVVPSDEQEESYCGGCSNAAEKDD